MIDSPQALRHAEHAEHERLMADFIARGGSVEHLPRGQCNWDSLNNRAKINPHIPPAEFAAKRRQERATPALPVEKLARPERPKREPKPKAPKLPKLALPGTQKARILEALALGQFTASQLGTMLGYSRQVVIAQLAKLREHGRVESTGGRHNMTWKLVACPTT